MPGALLVLTLKVPQLGAPPVQGKGGSLLTPDFPHPAGMLHVSRLPLFSSLESTLSGEVLTHFRGCNHHLGGDHPHLRSRAVTSLPTEHLCSDVAWQLRLTMPPSDLPSDPNSSSFWSPIAIKSSTINLGVTYSTHLSPPINDLILSIFTF